MTCLYLTVYQVNAFVSERVGRLYYRSLGENQTILGPADQDFLVNVLLMRYSVRLTPRQSRRTMLKKLKKEFTPRNRLKMTLQKAKK